MTKKNKSTTLPSETEKRVNDLIDKALEDALAAKRAMRNGDTNIARAMAARAEHCLNDAGKLIIFGEATSNRTDFAKMHWGDLPSALSLRVLALLHTCEWLLNEPKYPHVFEAAADIVNEQLESLGKNPDWHGVALRAVSPKTMLRYYNLWLNANHDWRALVTMIDLKKAY